MNERELHRLINESVTRLLNEWDGIVTSGDFDDPYEFSIYCNNNIDNDDSDEEDDNRIFNREEDIITKKSDGRFVKQPDGVYRDCMGIDREGYDQWGYDKFGFNRQGMHKTGYNKNNIIK